ncbi:hypothetical protein KC353_g25 [Hortaea werneckii]|nr:hypothetical protein KC353_g25 [Hortaea werneckii]
MADWRTSNTLSLSLACRKARPCHLYHSIYCLTFARWISLRSLGLSFMTLPKKAEGRVNVFCLSLKLFGHLDPMHEYPRWCPRRYPLRACRFVISHASIASVFGMDYRFKGLRNNEMISIPASSAVGSTSIAEAVELQHASRLIAPLSITICRSGSAVDPPRVIDGSFCHGPLSIRLPVEIPIWIMARLTASSFLESHAAKPRSRPTFLAVRARLVLLPIFGKQSKVPHPHTFRIASLIPIVENNISQPCIPYRLFEQTAVVKSITSHISDNSVCYFVAESHACSGKPGEQWAVKEDCIEFHRIERVEVAQP